MGISEALRPRGVPHLLRRLRLTKLISEFPALRVHIGTRIGVPSQPMQSLRAQILKKFKILKISSELEIFKRATQKTLFLWGILEVRIENFKRD